MSQELPKRKTAPEGVAVKTHGPERRSEILAQLDADTPEFVHSYQRPEILSADRAHEFQWEMEVKGQEVVKDAKGNVIHHMGDPVVRQRRDTWDAQRRQDAEDSRARVETVVEPAKSTVERSPKKQLDLTKVKR